jgi:hypothetical protein
MLQRTHITSTLLISNAVMHLMCCGLPLVMNIISMTGLLGIIGLRANALSPDWLVAYEYEILTVSGLVLLATAIIHYIGRYLDCRRDAGCTHEPCDTKKARMRNLFLAECAFYGVNVAIFLFAHEWHAH